MIPAVDEPAEIHVTEGMGLDDRDGLIIEGLDLGLGNIKREYEMVGRDSRSRMRRTGIDR